MSPRIKICGITSLDDARCCADAGADALGFIFYKKSPRFIRPAEARKIISGLPDHVAAVGVFVNETRKAIEAAAKETGIRVIQLSGDESPEDCSGFGLKVWKAFRIRGTAGVEKTRQYVISAAMLEGARDRQYGGSGTLPDFQTAIELKRIHPVVLAGGINPGNVAEAVRTVRPYAIDVNSGVETSPGRKDPEKVKLLFNRLKECNHQ